MSDKVGTRFQNEQVTGVAIPERLSWVPNGSNTNSITKHNEPPKQFGYGITLQVPKHK